MNKLLKVLEDRRVRFESAYYNPEDGTVPRYIHEVFRHGLPADFRLVGATTRSPETLPARAAVPRCMEVYFRALEPEEVADIAAGRRAPLRLWHGAGGGGAHRAIRGVRTRRGQHRADGRRGGSAGGRTAIGRADVEWVLDGGRYAARPASGALRAPAVGRVHGLAVYGAQQGAVMDVEAVAVRGQGRVLVTGIVEEEEMGPDGHRLRRKSMAPRLGRKRGDAAAPPGLCAGRTGPSYQFSGRRAGGRPVGRRGDAAAACSALTGRAMDGATALTGEVSVTGEIRAVGRRAGQD